MNNYIEIKGNSLNIKDMTFGSLTALGPVRKSKNGRIIWLCQCKCGNMTEVRTSHLMSGHTQSCGCLGSRMSAGERFSTHGLGKTKEYGSWAGIIQRCTNPNDVRYPDYGGRGITICEEWRHSFLAFYNHVSFLSHSGEKGYSIDRIDNNSNYEPGNVRWSTAADQNRNTRRNIMLTHNGKTQCLTDWANDIGVSPRMLHKRFQNGWSTEKILLTPARKQKGKLQ